MTVPHLTTALTGPLPDLERQILKATPAIEHWLRAQWQEHETPFYASVDLRNSSFKLAPVDTNLYPGGFNNLNPQFTPLCVQAAMAAIEVSLRAFAQRDGRSQRLQQAGGVGLITATAMSASIGSFDRFP